jgi:archaellin
VSTGNGTASGVIISADLNAGEMVYPDWVNNESTTEGADIINETITMKYGDTNIELNHVSLMYMVDDQPSYWDYYWEKSTGLLIKYTITGTEVDDNGTTVYLNYQQQRVGLQHVFYPLIDSADYPVTVDSNSAILAFEFNQTERNLRLNVSGTTGTAGSCEVTVPGSLLWGTFSLNMDGYPLVEGDDYTQSYNGTHYTFRINYIHSTHAIEIVGSDVIPEFPAGLLMPLFMIATLLAIIAYRRRLR